MRESQESFNVVWKPPMNLKFKDKKLVAVSF